MDGWFIFFRDIAFVFATLMLGKYFIFLILAPFYPAMETWRKYKLWGQSSYHQYQPKISVLIPAHNEEVGILSTLRSVLQNSYTNYEIIIINDGSTDSMEDKIFAFKSRLKKTNPELAHKIKYYSKSRGGKGSSLNYGLTKAQGEVILTVDADSAIKKDALKNVIHYFADDKIAAVVGNVKVANNNTLVGFVQELEYLFGFYFKRAHAVMGAEYIFGGACAAFRKTIFDEIGHFDVSNKTEDIEMTLRIRAFGYACTYAEDVICYTEGAGSFMSLVNQRLRWKKGRIDAFIRYRRLFFSTDPRHNKAMSFFVLPFSLLGELQLFFEPIAITLLIAYSIISGDYITFTLGLLFLYILYLVNALFSREKFNIMLLLIFFFSWPLFYLLVCVEYFSLIHSLRMLISDEDVSWQKWQRNGI